MRNERRSPAVHAVVAPSAGAVDSSLADESDRAAFHEAVVGSVSECVVVVDEAARVVFANQALEDVFGYAPESVVGERLTELVPERLRDSVLAAFAAHLRAGEQSVDWNGRRLTGRHRDGHEIPVLVSLERFTHDSDRYFVGEIRDITAQVERRERLSAEQALVESVFDALPDVVYAFDRDGQMLRWNDRANEVTGYTDAEIAELGPLTFVPDADEDALVAAIDRVLSEGSVETVESAYVTSDGQEIPYEFTGAPLVEDGEIVGVTGVGRDITARKRRAERLERLNDLNTVIRSVDRALIDATTRADVESAVPERLVSEGGYAGALLGQFERADRFTIDAGAGIDPDAFHEALPSGSEETDGLATAALRTDSVQVRADLCDSPVQERARDAREQAYRAVAAVPVVTDSRSFGVLGVYSDRSDAFGERERSILRELGRGVANAIQAALTHQLLYANTITEVEFRTTDDEVVFNTLSARLECHLTLDRVLRYGEDTMFVVSATDVTPSELSGFASDHPAIDDVEYLGSDENECIVEFVTDGGTLTEILIEHGSRTTAAEADHGVSHLTVELPPDGDVRTLVRALQSAYPETELVARREVTRTLQRPGAFRRDVVADLTEKQLAALEAAYFVGYFEWPARASSATEVAETLDIAPQTFHQHLRVALRKMLTSLFVEDVGHRSR